MSATVLQYEARRACDMPDAPVLQRGDGSVELAFVRRGAATVLADLYQRTPGRALFPRVAAGEPPVAVLLTTSGGLTGGDRLRIAARLEAGAAASLTTQAAEKIYRALGDAAAAVTVTLRIGECGWLEYLPQETILFDGARLTRRTTATLARGARLLACETLIFGRGARGEGFSRGLLHDAWRIRMGERLVWADALRLEGNVAAILADPAAFAGARALATALYAGEDVEAHLDTARRLAEGAACRGAASLVNRVLVARFFGDDAAQVRSDLARYLVGMRRAATGLPAALPRVWQS